MNFSTFHCYVKVNKKLQQLLMLWLLQTCKIAHPPASVDSERQDLVVEALLHHAEDLVLSGDLSALQALQTEQRDGRDRKRLAGRKVEKKFRGLRRKRGARRRKVGAASLTMGAALMDRAVKLGSQPILVRFG